MLFMKMESGLLIDFQQIKHEKLWNWNMFAWDSDMSDDEWYAMAEELLAQ